MVWNVFPVKGDFSFGKSQITGHHIWAVGQQSHLGDLMFCQKLCTRHDAWAGMVLWWGCQSPVAHCCSLPNHPDSFHRGMFKLKAKFDADSLLYSVILNVMATQYTCSLNGIYHPHCLVQWSPHCSRMCIPAHSPELPAYIDGAETALILTVAGLFLDRPQISMRNENVCSHNGHSSIITIA